MKEIIGINDKDATGDGILAKWKTIGGGDIREIAVVFANTYKDLAPVELLKKRLTRVSALAAAMNEEKKKDSGYLLDSENSQGKWVLLKRTKNYNAKNGKMPEYESRLRVAIDSKTQKISFNDKNHAAVERIKKSVRHHLSHIKARDIGALLTRFATHDCDGVAWREDGGVYYIPQQYVAKWRALAAALTEATESRIGDMPVICTEEGVASITDSLEAECDRLSAGVVKSLAKKVGKKALNTQATALENQQEKLIRHAARLKVSLSSVQNKMQKFQNDVAAAIIVAEGEDDQ